MRVSSSIDDVYAIRQDSGIARDGSRRWRSIRHLLCVTILLMGEITLLCRGYGQSASSAINGTITDKSAAQVPEARIILRNVDTNIQRVTSSGSSGTYSITDLSPGRYSLQVTKDGYATGEMTGIVLQVNQTATLDFRLTVGSLQQTLTVSANLSAVESTTSELGTVITTKSVNDLPLNGRNFTQLLTLTPGVSPISVAQNAAGGSGFGGLAVGAFTFPAVNGQRNRSNMFLLDGVNDLASFLGNYNYAPIIDDIQEFKVQSHNDLAEFGAVAGGIINVVTKSGTNVFHGSAWEFLRNEQLDARNFFLPTRNPLRQNQFGVAAGGPALLPHLYNGRNRTFYFFAYEGFRQSQEAQSIVRVPTAAQLTGDFSSLLSQGIQIYNPFSTRPDPLHPGAFQRDPFQGNIIPQNLLSPAAELYATLFPPAGPPLPGGNLYDTTRTLLNQDSYTGRMDQNFGSHDSMLGRVSYFSESSSGSAGYPGALKQIAIDGWNASVQESHVFGQSAVLNVHFGRNLGSDTAALVFPNAPANFTSSLINAGFSPKFIANFTAFPGAVIPSSAIAGYASTSAYNGQTEQLANTYEYGGDFTKVLNRHTIKVGYIYSTENFVGPVYAAGESFSSFQTSNLENPQGPSGAGTGDGLASFLLGIPTGSFWRDALVTEHGGAIQGGYVQDQYKVTPRLSLNIGVRYDLSKWPVYGSLANGSGYVGDLDLSNGTYLISAVPPACSPSRGAPCMPNGVLPANVSVTTNSDRSLHYSDYGNWQGRLGIAYRLHDATSVRAGYGRFYDEWNGVSQTAQNIGGTWPSVGAVNINLQNQNIPSATIGDPLGFGASGLLYPPNTPFGSPSYYYDPHLRTPYVDNWNLELDQQLSSSTTLSIAYVGSHSGRLDLGGLHNTAEFPGPGDTATVASRSPWPYITPTNYDTSAGNSNYNALQVKLNRTTHKGLTYLLSYTWSKSIDLACSGNYGAEGCELQNAYNPQGDRSVSGFDLTNSFSGSFIYDLPFGTGRAFNPSNKIMSYLADGWQVNAIVILYSGVPYDVTYQGDLANTGNTFVRANLAGNPTPGNRTPAEWINTDAFAIPPPYTFGDLGRNSLRSDWYRNLDCSLFRRFPLGDRFQLEFRAEAFNATNSVVFAAPANVINATGFGVVTSTANTPRQLQVALKLVF
jgi:outer membrane receptor protein involved in Fe transport